MNQKSPRKVEDEQRLAERATEWLSVLRNASAAERAEFVEWVMASPQNLREFLFSSAVERELRAVVANCLPELEKVLRTASPNVIPLPQATAAETALPAAISEPTRVPDVDRKSAVPWRWAAGLAAAMATLMVAWWQFSPGTESYATAAGEVRTVALDDGSVIHLNTRSHVEVAMDSRARAVRLVSGEVMFDVAHDATRPFKVYSGTSVIQAVGTQFNVLLRPFGTTVSVIEGLVQISTDINTSSHSSNDAGVLPTAEAPDALFQGPSKLAAGEEARIDLAGRIEKRTPIDIVSVAAWRQRRLEFRGDALGDIAAEFNRYNETPQITIEGEAIRARRYTGVFDANDPGSLVDFLRADEDLELEDRSGNIVIRTRNLGSLQ